MDTKKNQFTLLGLFRRFFLIVLVLALTYSSIVLLIPQKAYAAVDGVFIDKTAIRVGQDIYRDSNPFDGTYRWSLDIGSGCSNSISISDRAFASGNTNMTAPIVTKITLSRIFNNDCQSNGEDTITISEPARRLILGYRIDTRTIFMPVWYAYDRPQLNGSYRSTQDGDTEYLRNGDNYDDGGTRVNYTSGDRAQYQELRCGLFDAYCGTKFEYDFTLANGGSFATADAKAYPGAPKTSNPTDPGALDPGDSSNPTPPGGGTTTEDNSCESKGGALGWILCPVITALDGLFNWIDTQIQALLEIDESRYTDENLKIAWSNIRNIAYIILIPIMLVMVIGTALGFEIFSAYTIKRALPRMVIAVIFITLSWYIVTFLIGLSNVVGTGILGIITAPFREIQPAACQDGPLTLSCLFSAPGFSDGVGGGDILQSILLLPQAAAGIIGLVVFLILYGGMLLIAIGAGFLVLLARQLFLLALILVAPLAILAWIFPGNDGLWKAWWSVLSKLLIMFPLIMLLIGVGRIFALIINEAGGGGLEGTILDPILKLGAYILPYAAIPLTFKFAGGLFANLAGVVNNRQKGLFDRYRNVRNAGLKKLGNDAKNENIFKNVGENTRRARINTRAARLSNIGAAGFSLNSEVRKARIDSAMGTGTLTEARTAMKENQALAVLLGNEDYAEAGRSGRGFVKNKDGQYVDSQGRVTTDRSQMVARDGSKTATRAYLASRGYGEEDIQSVSLARGGMSQEAFNYAALLSIPGTGTGFAKGAGEMDAAINETVGNNRRLASTLLAEMRGTAERANRGDLKGGGFGKRRTALEAQFEAENNVRASFSAGRITEQQMEIELEQIQQQTTETVTDAAVYSTDSRGLASIKPAQLKEKILPSIIKSLDKASSEGNQREYERQLAKVASLYDQSQYQSPEVQEIISGLMARPIPNTPTFSSDGSRAGNSQTPQTVREAVDGARSNRDFQDHRRELGGARSPAEVARMNAEERAAYEAAMEARNREQ
jgi:hypothetical protein